MYLFHIYIKIGKHSYIDTEASITPIIDVTDFLYSSSYI